MFLSSRRKKLKIFKLKDETERQEFVNTLEEKVESGNMGWSELQSNIIQVCKDVCGVTSGRRGRERETWW